MITVCGWISIASAQKCDFGGDKAFQNTQKLLSDAPSCTAASHILKKCLWGSSADLQFSSIVIEKCETSFRTKLTSAQESIYKEKMELCSNKYSDMEGTIAISEAALCKVGVAENFSENPAKAATPVPRASFNCDQAVTPLERSICSNRKLGIADLNLSEAYKGILPACSRQQRQVLVLEEKHWLNTLSERCNLSSKEKQSSRTVECLQIEFKSRLQLLNSCSMVGPEECVNQIKLKR